ncbi:MAG TPA: hypothetical protein VKF80_05530 [Candidatus Eisenbacteria bacterium]|nr:hypothetical protein [Candidatus Eisenbacteria bacterium]
MRFVSPSLSSRAARSVGVLVAVIAFTLTLHAAPLRADDATSAAPPAASAPAIPGAASGTLNSLPMGAFFDPTRMSFHQTLEFGASTGGLYRGTAGLYTASFGYKLARPLTMQLDLGAAYTPSVNTGAFGAASYNPGFNGLFVKNFSLDWRPGSNSLVRFSYQDVRSPLQWGPYGAPGYGYSPSPFGYTDLPEQPSRN